MVLFVFQVYPVCNFGKTLSILDLALSGEKGLRKPRRQCQVGRHQMMALKEITKLHGQNAGWFLRRPRQKATTTGTKTPQICIFNEKKNSFARSARAFFILVYFFVVFTRTMT